MFNYPFSLDVISLYTSIPPQDATEVAQRLMQEHSMSFKMLNDDDVGRLLQVVLTNNYFTFNNRIFQQSHGLAMGNSVSAILAILYMDHVEKQALNVLNNHVAFYCRYVDDVFLLVKNRSEAEHVQSVFNQIDPHIKFDIEHPDHTNTLKLLDVAIRIDSGGRHYTEFYKKKVKKPLFVN